MLMSSASQGLILVPLFAEGVVAQAGLVALVVAAYADPLNGRDGVCLSLIEDW